MLIDSFLHCRPRRGAFFSWASCFVQCGVMPIQSKQSKSGSEAKKLAPDQRTEQRGSTWSFSSPPASSRSEIADAGSQFTITQMVAEGKRLQGEAFCARTHPGQEAAISQASDDITQQLPRQADDGWIEVVSTATGAGTIGMLVEATPNASRAAAGTPHNIVNALPQKILTVLISLAVCYCVTLL